MKKVALILAFLFIIAVPLEVSATSRALQTMPSLIISGTTAQCTATVIGDQMTDHLKVTMKLLYGNRILASWTSEGYGYVAMSETTTVSTGKTYKLLVEVIANGVAKDPVYVTGTC